MAWLISVISGAMETAWAIALQKTEGFSRPMPTAIFVTTLILSMAGLGYALKFIPVGTAYAVWVGIGAAGTPAGGERV
ncbi:DMT family transporter [Streptosporangium canum]|jgi:quaternary ammonium compound-resistance protein SugE|uniref:DMT family transporter n=1 Tax=Streptosporangium canum TaxID=324952 RepID=UPI0037A9AE22